MSAPPIYLAADSRLLFWQAGEARPFLDAVLRESGTARPRAAYVGASNGDHPGYYEIFAAALDQRDVADRCLIASRFRAADRDFLATARVILLAGGDVERGWRVLEESGMGAAIRAAHRRGAVLAGISAGAVQLGLGMAADGPRGPLLRTFGLVPHFIGAHEEASGWAHLRRTVELGAPATGIGIPFGGGLVCEPGGAVRALRVAAAELRWERGGIAVSELPPQAE